MLAKEGDHEMSDRENKRFDSHVLPGFFFLLGLAVYSSVINSFFISDDFSHLQRIFNFFPHDFFLNQCSDFYRPLFYLSMLIDYKIWGFSPCGFHATNILIHSLNSFLVFLITRLLLRHKTRFDSYGFAVALVAGAWYLFLPVHAEAVAWISGRADLLATFFALLSFLGCYCYNVKNNSRYLFAAASLYFLALLSKESVITFPLIITGCGLFLNGLQKSKKIKLAKEIWIFAVFSVVFSLYLLMRFKAVGVFIGGYGREVHLNLNPQLIFMNLIAYSARIFLPPSANIEIIFYICGSVFVLAMIAFRSSWRKSKGIFYFLLWAYFVSVLPVINLGTNFLKDTQGERFVYFPSVFPVIFLAIFLGDVLKAHKKLFIVFCMGMIFFLGARLFQTNEDWNTAGRISKNIINMLKQTKETGSLVALTLPDNIKGAYIFRNGFWQAIALFVSPQKFLLVEVISLCAISNENDAMEISLKDNMGLIRALNANVCFSRFDKRYVLVESGNSFKFDLRRLDRSNLLYYSAGEMKRIRS